MKKYVLMTSLTLLVACTESRPNLTSTAEDYTGPEHVIELSDVALGNSGLDAQFLEVPEIDIGITNNLTTRKNAILTLKNTTDSQTPIAIEPILDHVDGFSIKLNRCSSLSKGQSCQITVSFSNRGLYNITDTRAVLKINSQDIQLKASIIDKPNPAETGTPALSIALDSAFLPQTSISYRTLTIQNTGNGVASNLTSYLPSDMVVRLNRCPSALAPQKSCSLQIMLKNFRSVKVPESSSPISISAIAPNSSEVVSVNLNPEDNLASIVLLGETYKPSNNLTWQYLFSHGQSMIGHSFVPTSKVIITQASFHLINNSAQNVKMVAELRDEDKTLVATSNIVNSSELTFGQEREVRFTFNMTSPVIRERLYVVFSQRDEGEILIATFDGFQAERIIGNFWDTFTADIGEGPWYSVNGFYAP